MIHLEKNQKMSYRKVYLTGTRNGSDWQQTVISKLTIEYFWEKEDSKKINSTDEEYALADADFLLHVITPKIDHFESISELIDNSNKNPEKTLFCFLLKDGEQEFTLHQQDSMIAIGKMVTKNGGRWFQSLDDSISFLNNE